MSSMHQRNAHGLDWSRRVRDAVATIAIVLLFSAAVRAETGGDGKRMYRGFTIDLTQVQNSKGLDALADSIAHQIDIVADCGAKPEVLRFFQSQEILVKPELRGKHGGGQFSSRSPGIAIDDAVMPAQKPIILHELLHAFHFRVMPGGFKNADIIRF